MAVNKRQKNKIRVRIAPSPTGALHIGTARTALFNYLFAKQNKGKFILRIEDTDLKRSDPKWEKDILEGLRWLGIKWDEGPILKSKFQNPNVKLNSKSKIKNSISCGSYRQSERIEIYEKYIKQLLEDGKAFWCEHTKKELELEKQKQMERKETPRHECENKNQSSKIKNQNDKSKLKNRIIRLDTVKKIVKFNDLIRGEIEFDSGSFGDISIAKDEKTPLYNFAVVVDDYEMNISHVIRGEDHISNTPKQILIQEALGFQRPQYAHLPLILGPDRSKLSKRHGATSITEYREEGYLAEAMVNFMAMLGWNPGDNREIFSLKELIKEFSLEKIQKSGAVFNINKLNWINGNYIRQKSVKELAKLILKDGFLKSSNNEDYIEAVIALEQPRLQKLSEIEEKTDYFFEEPKYDKELLRWKKMNDDEIKNSLNISKKIIFNFQFSIFNKDKIERVFLKEAKKFKDRGELLWPLRVALSGKKASPGPFEIAAVLGKDEVLKRLSNAIDMYN